MNDPLSFRFDSMPSLWTAYWRILTSGKSRVLLDGAVVPRLEAVLPNASVSASHLARYRQICSLPRSDVLPIAYLHVLAMPMHLALMTSESFPVHIMGFVHIRSRLIQHIPLPNDARGELRTWIHGHQDSAFGHEYTLHTQFRFRDDIAWTEECTYLSRRKGKRDRSKVRELREARVAEFPQPGTAHASRFRVDAALARRYAMNSGDWNPIHLTDMTSRTFGFERAMIHGMWSLARCAGTFSAEALHSRCTVDAAFKAPVFLPADLTAYTWATDVGEAFALRNSDNQRAHLTGVLTLGAPR